MLLSQAVEELILAVEAEGRSVRTVEDYRQKLGVLMAFLGDVPVETITASELRAYAADLRRRPDRYVDHPLRGRKNGGLSEASVASYLRVARRLCRFLHEEGVLLSNPANRLRIPKRRNRQPRAYDPGDFLRLLAATAGVAPGRLRDRAIVLMLADTGCRAGGLVGLRLGDLDLGRLRARVVEKGGKGRLVYYTTLTRDALATWLAVRPAVTHDHVFVNFNTGGVLQTGGLYELLRRLGRRAGCQGPVNPHAFRHGFAREFLRNGGDLGTLADLLGHTDIATTWQSYAVFTNDELAEAHQRHSPVAKLGGEGVQQADLDQLFGCRVVTLDQ